jgi:DMSO/TMAO reductase YedYZ molybdopterin-dependent catalytic subunit
MSFFARNREELEAKGIDPGRIPPGQYYTERFPVLHAGSVPKVDLAEWDFTVDGLVVSPQRWDYQDVLSMPVVRRTFDIHCVTKWSKLDTEWEGVPVTELMSGVELLPAASHVLVMAEQGFTANLPVADFMAEENLLAYRFGGVPLDTEHGWPLRLVIPHLYFWKSVKWVRGVRFLSEDEPGFWERNGYHMYGDPWKEQRFWGD